MRIALATCSCHWRQNILSANTRLSLSVGQPPHTIHPPPVSRLRLLITPSLRPLRLTRKRTARASIRVLLFLLLLDRVHHRAFHIRQVRWRLVLGIIKHYCSNAEGGRDRNALTGGHLPRMAHLQSGKFAKQRLFAHKCTFENGSCVSLGACTKTAETIQSRRPYRSTNWWFPTPLRHQKSPVLLYGSFVSCCVFIKR